MIKLKGLFDISLGGFACIRGYAKLGDLAKSSKADDYQRDLLSKHKDEISQFLSDRENLFFPEVVLSCKLLYDFNKKNAVSGLNPIANIRNKTNFQSNVNKLSIRFQKSTELATITINEDIKESLFNRVDGNHRLSAASIKDEFKEYITPFCIIILSDDFYDNQKDKIIFHNINFKSIPLEEEHILKIFLDDEESFSDDFLKGSSLGWEYYLSRKIIAYANEFKNIKVIKNGDAHRTIIKNIVKILLDKNIVKKEDKSTEKIVETLREIDLMCKSKPVLGNNNGVFSALVILQIEKPSLTDAYIKWVENNLVYSIQEISTTSLLDIFSKRIEAKSRDIFVSLHINSKQCEKNFAAINSVIEKINEQYFSENITLKLNPIRIDKSDNPCTFQITDEIIQKIEDCGLFIADLTGLNCNVYHESGYAMGYIKGKGLENKILFILHHEKDDKNTDEQVAFNLRNFSQIRFSSIKELKKEIEQKIRDNYGLNT